MRSSLFFLFGLLFSLASTPSMGADLEEFARHWGKTEIEHWPERKQEDFSTNSSKNSPDAPQQKSGPEQETYSAPEPASASDKKHSKVKSPVLRTAEHRRPECESKKYTPRATETG